MATTENYETLLAKLDCHFCWQIEQKLKDNNKTISSIISKLDEEIEWGPELKLVWMMFKSYLYTIDEQVPGGKHEQDFNEALKLIDKIETEINPKQKLLKSIHSEFVLNANKLHILYIFNGKIDKESLTDLINQREEREGNSKLVADLYGVKALCLSRLGPGVQSENYVECVQLLERAMAYDSKQSYWPYKRAQLIGSIRWMDNGRHFTYSETEEKLWERAVRLRPNDCLCKAEFAKYLADGGRQRCFKNLESILEILREAENGASENSRTVCACIKVYKDLERHKICPFARSKIRELIQIAEEKYTNSAECLLEIATFYRFDEDLRDEEKSKEYYKKCLEVDPSHRIAQLRLLQMTTDKSQRLNKYLTVLRRQNESPYDQVTFRIDRAKYLIELKDSGDDDTLIMNDLRYCVENDGAMKNKCVWFLFEKNIYLRYVKERAVKRKTDPQVQYDLAWIYNHIFPDGMSLGSSPVKKWMLEKINGYRKKALEICDDLVDRYAMVEALILKADILVNIGDWLTAKNIFSSNSELCETNESAKKVKAKVCIAELNVPFRRVIDRGSIDQLQVHSVMDILTEVASLGYSDYISVLLFALKKICNEDADYLRKTTTLQCLGKLKQAIATPNFVRTATGRIKHAKNVSIVQKALNTMEATVEGILRNHDSYGYLFRIRKKRSSITNPDSDEGEFIIEQSRIKLDKIHDRLGKTLKQKPSDNTAQKGPNLYFPFPSEGKDVESEMKQILHKKQKLNNFSESKKTKELFEFLVQEFNSSENHWLRQWSYDVNQLKHKADFMQCDYSLERIHAIGEFADKVVCAYTKVIEDFDDQQELQQ